MQETPALEPDSSLLRSHHTTAIFHFALSVCNQVTFLITLTSEAFLKAALVKVIRKVTWLQTERAK